ncbi:glutathione peroxidase [Breznakia pachnodae]|uniref:Glutathione peroxidase n=1 Tax=Breznakia pachnodae TaxID=265178 RepID=A0ABU0E583_9FIRM|nr:glutathione peroxidase [Breznakia pachnodae]MDQ0361965.1 glutathione peroxidase [Breznakia pachnodae]
MSLYDLTAVDAEGKDVSLSEYKGKVLLVVNTATGCGFTPQYEGLQELYDKYKDQGLEILDFPCNQFGHQAPGTDKEIGEFCQMNYQTTFKRFAKVDVNGSNESPVFTYLKKHKSGLIGSKVKWNFTKFLIDRDGNLVDRFAPTKKPEELESDIIKLL